MNEKLTQDQLELRTIIGNFMASTPLPQQSKTGRNVFDGVGVNNYGFEDMIYDESWDWIKPVIDKIMKVEASYFNYDAQAMITHRILQGMVASHSVSESLEEILPDIINYCRFHYNYTLSQKD